MAEKKYYPWVDDLKLFACVSVVVGHFVMSMAAAYLSRPVTFDWFIYTLYTFHVPLFFVCSGFLYQKSNKVHSLKEHKKNVISKFINLSVPYFIFSAITVFSKQIFSDLISTGTTEIFNTLFINPTAPYWYLYVLFFMFLVIPNFNSEKSAGIFLAFSALLLVVYTVLYINNISLPIYILNSYLSKTIWFAYGMYLAFRDEKKITTLEKILAYICFAAASVLSVIFFKGEDVSVLIKNIVSVMYVFSLVTFFRLYQFKPVNKFSRKFAKYFMPVFLMHTIFAAGFRIVLVHFGIRNVIIHYIVGISTSFLVPILIYKIIEKTPLLFFFQPQKVIEGFKKKAKSKEK